MNAANGKTQSMRCTTKVILPSSTIQVTIEFVQVIFTSPTKFTKKKYTYLSCILNVSMFLYDFDQTLNRLTPRKIIITSFMEGVHLGKSLFLMSNYCNSMILAPKLKN